MDARPGIRYEVIDPVAVVTIDRPDALGALTFGQFDALRECVELAVADERVVGIIITGTGRGFCAGLDLGEVKKSTEGAPFPETARGHGRFPGMFSYLMDQPKPIIAAVNGITAGGGLVLATMCDLRFASTDASFVSVFARRGLIGEVGVTWALPHLIGRSRTLDLLWSSRPVDAQEALGIGLVDHVVAPDDLVEAAAAYIRRLADDVAPSSLAETKRLVYEQLGVPAVAALQQSVEATELAARGADAVEGARAFMDRRPPRFARLGRSATEQHLG